MVAPEGTLQRIIIDRLKADAALALLLPGGIWDFPLKRNQGSADEPTPGSTPGAFDADGLVRPSAVVNAPTENAETGGALGAFRGFTTIWLYCQPLTNPKAALDDAWWRIRVLLHRHDVALSAGTAARLTVIGRLGQQDDPTEDRRVIDNLRLQIAGLWEVGP